MIKTQATVGSPAPDFELPSQNGTKVKLKDLLGQKSLVLFFYPKDNTAICTKESCAFRDSHEVFKDAGAEVVGISSDSEESHKGFAETNRLPYLLLSDAGGKVRKLYGVPTTLGFIPGRVTYVIDRQGIIRHIFNSQMNAQKHVDEALQVVRELAS